LINILKDNNLNTKNIVIEINKVIITRDHWENMKINENDSIEIITAVGGG
jgi:thiamine biosynthesis protein ThiS